MHLSLRMALSACFASVLLGSAANADENLLNMEHLRAGLGAGWLAELDNVSWTADDAAEPFGTGAARLQFEGRGRAELLGPARALRAGLPHAAAVWVRSEPPGAKVFLTLRDNNQPEQGLLSRTAMSGKEWAGIVMQGVLPEALKGHYFLSLALEGENCTVWLDGLWLSEEVAPLPPEWRPPVHPAGVVLEPVAPWGVVTGLEVHRIKARVVGAQDGSRLALRLIHTTGATEDCPSVPINGTGFWQQTLELTGSATTLNGMLRVEAHVANTAGAPLSLMGETLLARAAEPVAGLCPDSPFGVHVALREPDVSAVARLGYKWCRIHDAAAFTKWGVAEPEPGKWRWFDAEIDLARNRGLCVLGMLDGSPAWESGTQQGGYWSIYGLPRSVDHWRTYVRAVVGHYAGRIDRWEVWNEPWDMFRFFPGGTPQFYAKLLRAAYEEAKTANPDSTIAGVNTYPPFWEQLVLAEGAYPYFDMLSWHRYDPNLHGRPNDAIARVAARLNAEQAKYGAPKPLLFSEGGPDVARFHGSFFSFANPEIVGDWSRGADQYARMYLSAIAAGNRCFIAYSTHDDPRHGWPTHMLVEPEYLLKPMHLTLAALAHFVEGAAYRERLRPAHDISAHVFEQHADRPYGKAPTTIVVLHSDGDGEEPLPVAIPPGVHSFDRWGNPAALPDTAKRGLTFLVADNAHREPLLQSLRGKTETGPLGEPAAAEQQLAEALCRALANGDPPLWTLFSSQGSLAVSCGSSGAITATREELRRSPERAQAFRLDATCRAQTREARDAGRFVIGELELAGSSGAPAKAWFAATPDGPRGALRFLTLTVLRQPETPDAGTAEALSDLAHRWEGALREGHTRGLHGIYHNGACLMAAATQNGEYFVFREPDYLVTMLDTAVMWGAAARSLLTIDGMAVQGDVAVMSGTWDIASPAFGAGPYPFTGTLLHDGSAWRFASFCAGGATN